MAARGRGSNAIYLELLQNQHEQLKASSSLAAPHYARAIAALSACPVPMNDVEALGDLDGFSPGLKRWLAQAVRERGGEATIKAKRTKAKQCRASDLSLLDSLDAEGEEAQDEPEASTSRAISSSKSAGKSTIRKRKAVSKKDGSAKPKAYTPPRRSGGWGILIGLWLLTQQEPSTSLHPHFSKDDIISTAKKYSRSSYTHSIVARFASSSSGSGAGKAYSTAWDTMRTLLKHDLVWQTGRPAMFGLSEVGLEVARSIAKEEGKLNEAVGEDEGSALSGEEDEQDDPQLAESSDRGVPQLASTASNDIDAEYEYILHGAPATASSAARKRKKQPSSAVGENESTATSRRGAGLKLPPKSAATLEGRAAKTTKAPARGYRGRAAAQTIELSSDSE